MQFTKIDRDQATRKMRSADDKLEALAKQHAKHHGGDLAKGYHAALQTPEGRKLYADRREAHRAV